MEEQPTHLPGHGSQDVKTWQQQQQAETTAAAVATNQMTAVAEKAEAGRSISGENSSCESWHINKGIFAGANHLRIASH